ncbi:hypothetical protein [Eubacterium oxidoreducens]|uniref:Uncharacterized protein n=1 Tax=Eubacterium oxidoreducens TaxID=1732 RepID=A0A1G6ABJ1_EUBOX|nr:hypothetical protein [Eubacterium oxidoreducens]SDB05772.1 hypothetical protein SAMN02910417_00392 [Eubacterium oxidoreducens]
MLRNNAEIFCWYIKNAKTVFVTYLILFWVLIPVIACVYTRGGIQDDSELVYTYSMYVMSIVVAMFGSVPLFISFQEVYKDAVYESIQIAGGFRESCIFAYHYVFSAIVLGVTSLIVRLVLLRVDEATDIWRCMGSYLVLVWLSMSVAHFVIHFTKAVYPVFVFVEIYAILCQIMNVGRESWLNAYSILDEAGSIWWKKLLVYALLGFFLEQIIWRRVGRRSDRINIKN